MSIVYILTALILNNVTFAALAPPEEIQSNVSVAKEVVAKFKNVNDAMMGYYAEVKLMSDLCDKATKISEKDCAIGSSCAQFANRSIRGRVSFCMTGFQRIKSKGDLIELKNETFLSELVDHKYDNFPLLRVSLKDEAKALFNSLLKAQKFLDSSNKVFRQKYLDILNQEFEEVSRKAELKGKIKGHCIYLKQKIIDLESQYLLNLEHNDFGTWYLFRSKVSAYKTTADALRAKCPSNFQPADYIDIDSRVQLHLGKLDKKKWMNESCEMAKKNPHYRDLCDVKHIESEYLIPLLLEARK